MRIGHPRLLLAWLGLMLIAQVTCRPGAQGGAPSDTAKPATKSGTGTSAASGTVRTDSVVLRTDKAQYRSGEQMTLTFENRSASTYTFNPCQRSVERESGGSWSAVVEDGRMCTMEAWVLDPHGARSGPTELPASLAPGRYRVVVRMAVEGPGGVASAVSAVSDPVSVS
jgi:Big-like domain-containing protein